jgi:hypothetical protein
MEGDAKRYFRDELREARSAAFRDAEGFQALVFAIERLGSTLSRKAGTLGNYRDTLVDLALQSALAENIPALSPEWHTPFASLYKLVKQGRNDALHQGAYARLVTEHAVQLSLVLEDALMEGETLVRDFMVRGVVCAVPWQPLSAVRQLMLTSSFSFLPLWAKWESQRRWLLLSDYGVAKFLRASGSGAERNKRLATQVQVAIQNGALDFQEAEYCNPHDPISTVLAGAVRRIVLVRDPENADHLVGVVTPFDVL